MLVSQRPVSQPYAGQGCLRSVLAQMQCRGADSSRCEDRLRQRLQVLARRLARVQALGNEYARVTFSQDVLAAMRPCVPVA